MPLRRANSQWWACWRQKGIFLGVAAVAVAVVALSPGCKSSGGGKSSPAPAADPAGTTPPAGTPPTPTTPTTPTPTTGGDVTGGGILPIAVATGDIGKIDITLPTAPADSELSLAQWTEPADAFKNVVAATAYLAGGCGDTAAGTDTLGALSTTSTSGLATSSSGTIGTLSTATAATTTSYWLFVNRLYYVKDATSTSPAGAKQVAEGLRIDLTPTCQRARFAIRNLKTGYTFNLSTQLYRRVGNRIYLMYAGESSTFSLGAGESIEIRMKKNVLTNSGRDVEVIFD